MQYDRIEQQNESDEWSITRKGRGMSRLTEGYIKTYTAAIADGWQMSHLLAYFKIQFREDEYIYRFLA
jgi:hypothetical protein